MACHFIISYRQLKSHVDPDFRVMTYGDSGPRGARLKRELTKGSYVFFNTRLGDCKYLTGYFVVEQVISGQDTKKLYPLSDAAVDDWVVVGDESLSKKLNKPLPIDKSLMEKLSIPTKFKPDDPRSELSIISSYLRPPRVISDDDRKLLLQKIQQREANNKIENHPDVQRYFYFYDNTSQIIPLNETYKMGEHEIELLLRKNPASIEPGAKLIDYQKVLPDGDRLDLLLEDSKGHLIVAELKAPNELTDSTVTQVASYTNDIQKEFPGKVVRTMIICDGNVSPKFAKACNSFNIEIVVYGMQINCFKLT